MITCQKKLFDIPDGVTYLNAAYMGPLTKRAAEIGRAAVEKKLNPWSIAISDFFDLPNRVYDLSARMIDANPSDMAIESPKKFFEGGDFNLNEPEYVQNIINDIALVFDVVKTLNLTQVTKI